MRAIDLREERSHPAIASRLHTARYEQWMHGLVHIEFGQLRWFWEHKLSRNYQVLFEGGDTRRRWKPSSRVHLHESTGERLCKGLKLNMQWRKAGVENKMVCESNIWDYSGLKNLSSCNRSCPLNKIDIIRDYVSTNIRHNRMECVHACKEQKECKNRKCTTSAWKNHSKRWGSGSQSGCHLRKSGVLRS